MEILVISGLSGAGKSCAASCLEDIGYYTVDNMPAAMILKFAEFCAGGSQRYDKVALVYDVRTANSPTELFDVLDVLKHSSGACSLLFLEAEPETIIKRYKETRRAHPLMTGDVTLTQAVELERAAMEPVRERAAYVLETTALPTKKLRDEVLRLFAPNREKREEMSISVTSFGFKYGIPMEADMVFDARFLPNPFYIDGLRNLTGLDEPVRNYIFGFPSAREFLAHLEKLMAFLLPQFVEEGKSALVIAVGCTGGKHRSVAVTRALAEIIREMGYSAGENHRDMTRA